MADENKVTYHIIIDTNDGGGAEVAQPTKPQDAPTQPKYEDPKNAVQKLIDFKNQVQGIAGYSIAVGLGKQAFSFASQVVLRNEGNSIVSQRVNNVMDIAGKVGAIGGGFVLSAATNNVMGMFASFGAAISTVMSYAQEIEQRNYEANWDNADLMLKRERGGSALNRSRL